MKEIIISLLLLAPVLQWSAPHPLWVNQQEQWYATPRAETSKIKLITRLHGEQPLQATITQLGKMGLSVEGPVANTLWTKPSKIEGEWYTLKVSVETDSIIVLSGQWHSAAGLGVADLPNRTEWKTIHKETEEETGGVGFERMRMIARGIPSVAVQYNR